MSSAITTHALTDVLVEVLCLFYFSTYCKNTELNSCKFSKHSTRHTAALRCYTQAVCVFISTMKSGELFQENLGRVQQRLDLANCTGIILVQNGIRIYASIIGRVLG